MSMHDDKVCLKDMLCHASEAVELLGNMNKEALGDTPGGNRGRSSQSCLYSYPEENSPNPVVRDYWNA